MRQFKSIFLLFFLTIGATAVLPSSTINAQQQKIEGEVLTNDNKAIPSVLVRAYRGSIKVGEATTGMDGKYVITFGNGNTITLVRYDCTNWDPATIDDVSGMRNHTINKVMYRVGSKLSLNQALPLLSTLQRVYFVDRANNVTPAELVERYGYAMETTRFPQQVQPQVQQVRRLYGLM